MGDPVITQFFAAKIVNQQDQNLVFGSAALYNPDSIQLLRQKNPPLSNGFVSKNPLDSALYFEIIQPIAKNYIYYNSQIAPDSVEIKWLIKTRKCCRETYNYYAVDSVKFNNTYIKPVNGILIFKK